MTAEIIDGKAIAQTIRQELKKKVGKMRQKPGLALVRIGNDEASKIYVSSKKKACEEVGIYSQVHELPERSTMEEAIAVIDSLNQSKKIHAILLQLPVPSYLDGKVLMDGILPHKDVDGFHPVNLGNLVVGEHFTVPCTPLGIMKLIESTGVSLEGKHAVVIGRSNIVGKPIALLLLEKNATVTIAHSKTKGLASVTKQADVLVSAVGRAGLITANMVKKGAVVIDVGINRVGGRVVGDVDFDKVKEVAGFITPVPGGVGPMTIAMLLANTLTCMEEGKF